ncbi:MAG TPA: hypothetical protein VFU17_10080 [Candidatus Limnocylindrales bacterium]|nr:hypothetical protein [Candidatus Limnocylindrales bacterium]
MSIEPNLHEVSDALLANLDRLRALELEKRSLPIGSPRIVELAREIEELAILVLGTSDTQVDLAKAAVTEARAGELDPNVTIEELSAAPRELHVVLAEWRDAERRLGEVASDSPEALRLRGDIEVLRAEYRRAHEAAARRSSGPE